MPEIITDAIKVSDVNQAQLVISMEPMAKALDPNSFIFEHILRSIGGGVQNVGRMKHEWREYRLMSVSTVTTAAATAGATSIAVSTPALGQRDMLVYCPASNEVFAMDEDVGGTAAANAIKVRKKDAATGTGIVNAIPNGSVLLFLNESHAEGEDIPPAFATKEENFETYLQQMDETIQITDIANNEMQYGEDELTKQRRKKYTEFMKRHSLSLYTGQAFRETASASGRRRHGMSGLIEYLHSRAIDASGIPGGFTMRTFGTWIRPTKAHGSSSSMKLGIAGQNATLHIGSFPENYVRTVPGEQSTWGVSVKKLHTPFGECDIAYDLLLSQEYGLADRMFILDPDPDCISLKQLQGLPLVVKTNIQNRSDVHNIKDVVTGTRGLVLKLPELHQEIYGIN